ncbi:hypothetical protein [Massilia timonae]|uniref:Uncharacterized protein n=1 Tax=Massilia timonae TaxID=47229 RepID=A0A1S2NCA6_9BURK|nr:hypothetical protein [Massilia timonae]OIJ42012.1 hypothetical protein LO55_5069 [Massilia timonae]
MNQAITTTASDDLMTGTGAPRPIGSPVYEAQARAAAAWATGRSWSILLTSANHGVVGPLGHVFKHAGEHHERVVVVEVPTGAGAPSDEVNLVLRAAPAAESGACALLTDERAAFERHERGSNLRRVGVDRDGSGGWYENPCVQSAWEGWRARAEVAAQAGQVAPADGDLLDVARTLCTIAARRTELPAEKRKHYPHADEEGSPLLAVARAACLARGYTEDGLAAPGVIYPVPPVAGQVAVPEMTDAQIVAVWQAMPGGPDGWLKQFGYLQFARALLAVAPVPCAAGLLEEIAQSWDGCEYDGAGAETMDIGAALRQQFARFTAAPSAPAVAQQAPACSVEGAEELPLCVGTCTKNGACIERAASQPLIGKLLDQLSGMPVLWGLGEPGALVRHGDVFKMLIDAGKAERAQESAHGVRSQEGGAA